MRPEACSDVTGEMALDGILRDVRHGRREGADIVVPWIVPPGMFDSFLIAFSGFANIASSVLFRVGSRN